MSDCAEDGIKTGIFASQEFIPLLGREVGGSSWGGEDLSFDVCTILHVEVQQLSVAVLSRVPCFSGNFILGIPGELALIEFSFSSGNGLIRSSRVGRRVTSGVLI
ncbi:hypothetical protein C0992_001008, partial [Termitomyces sp. T32_za158]